MKNRKFTRRSVMVGGLAGTGALLVPFNMAFGSGAAPTEVVETGSGRVRGERRAGVSRFLGIPYGDDTAQYRFQPPRPAKSWTGVRDCLTPGAKAPQGALTISGVMNSGTPNGPGLSIVMAVAMATNMPIAESEDCLFLNVFTPEASHGGKRPVMVWLHGGGLAMGSGFDPMTDGSTLAAKGDVVVVSLNHRLNALGYLYLGDIHEDFADSGNVGQLDIVLALQWVRDNIAAFGGDPDNVTIFGESGGGMKVGAMMGMAPARGLFHKAIAQSGPIVKVVTREDAAYIAERTLAELGVARGDVHKLQTMDYRAVIAAASGIKQPGGATGLIQRTLAPMVDGRAMPAHPFDPEATDLARDVPLMIGTCKDECTLFMAGDGEFGKITVEQARQKFDEVLGEGGEAAFEVYRDASPEDSPTYWVSSLMTDLMFRTDSIIQADRKAEQKGAPVFMYRVDFEPRVLDRLLRSPHGTDVPLMFGTLLPPEFIGTGPEVEALSATMMGAWVNFARNGDPSQDGLVWPRYETGERLNMIFDVQSKVVSDPDQITRKFWVV